MSQAEYVRWSVYYGRQAAHAHLAAFVASKQRGRRSRGR